MNKIAHYLQQHLVGEVLTSPDVLKYFSTDESIFEIRPLVVVHPRNENDLRKSARFTWQLAERGRVIPITIKGKGTDVTGASLGNGLVLSTPAHMNKIIELDPKSGIISVETGAVVGKVQQTLYTHGRFIPAFSNSAEYSTIGGAVANNDAGSGSYKFGPIREFVRGTRTVLANGELIKTERLTKRELNKKLGLASFEGEIYRKLDKLIEDSPEVIDTLKLLGVRSNVGYAVGEVKQKDGSFDLTPIMVGSQGTLGLISEVTFDTVAYNPKTSLVVGLFDNKQSAWEAVAKINQFKDGPLSVDFVDKSVISHVQKTNQNLFKGTIESNSPDTILFVEIGGDSERSTKKIIKKVSSVFDDLQAETIVPEQDDVDRWQSVKDSSAHFLSYSDTKARALPLLDDAVLPVERCSEFISRVEALMAGIGLEDYAFWGQAGSGIIHTAPMFDISAVGDRQKMFKLMDEYYSLVAEMGGSTSGKYAEGRLRGAQSYRVLKPEAIDLMRKVKAIFDPFNALNPGVKVDVDMETLKPLLRTSYSFDHQYSHLPRS